MKKLPLVSIIIPVYNVKLYLSESLESVINQTYQNLEIIAIDDGSTDGSDLICEQYKRIDSRIKVIHQENRGLSAARNLGLDVMSGDIISFLDPDDIFELNMIEIMVKSMFNTQSDMVICSYNVFHSISRSKEINSTKEFQIKHGVISSKEALNLLFEGRINISVWNKLYNKGLFDVLRFPEGYVYEDNYVIPLAIEKANRVALIKKPLLLHRKRLYSITTTNSEKNSIDWLRARNQLVEFVKGRTPSVFSQRQMMRYHEKLHMGMIYYYLDLLSLNSLATSVKNEFQCVIKSKAKDVCFYSIKSKLIYYTFELNPYFCLWGRRIYLTINKPFKKHVNRYKS